MGWRKAGRIAAGRMAWRALSTSVLDGYVDCGSSSFQEGMAHMDGLLAELRSTTETAMEGGGARATELHASRGKMLPRKRIEALLDPGAPFLELSTLAGHKMHISLCEVTRGESAMSAGCVSIAMRASEP